jgi:hypothetical protein
MLQQHMHTHKQDKRGHFRGSYDTVHTHSLTHSLHHSHCSPVKVGPFVVWVLFRAALDRDKELLGDGLGVELGCAREGPEEHQKRVCDLAQVAVDAAFVIQTEYRHLATQSQTGREREDLHHINTHRETHTHKDKHRDTHHSEGTEQLV